MWVGNLGEGLIEEVYYFRPKYSNS